MAYASLRWPSRCAASSGASRRVRFTALAESLRSELWRFQTRTGDYGPSLDEEQALDHLVTQADALNLRTIAQWSADRLAAPAADTPAPATPAAAKAAPPAVQT